MKASLDAIVLDAVARHLDVPSSTLRADRRLDEDLGLDPLDLALIALRLEELVEIEFPIARLDEARVVGDLVRLARGSRPRSASRLLRARPARCAAGF